MLPPLRVGVAGLGTVGLAVLQRLDCRAAALAAMTGRTIEITAVSAKNPGKDRRVDLSRYEWFDDPVKLAAAPQIDMFVELIGGADGVAHEAVATALRSGKSVVTANKALLAKHGIALAKVAEERNVALAFEASVAGSIPVIKTLREALAGNVIQRVYGILNGTCNYILSRMEAEALSFADCLMEAQRLGYAEADPSFDIGGYDTAHKLAILTALAFGTTVDPDAVAIEGISSITLADIKAAAELGYRIKLLGVADRTPTGIEQRVHPTMVPRSSAIAQVMGVVNAVTVDADAVHELTLMGPGAGGDATASAVVADIVDIAKGLRQPPFGLPVAHLTPLRRAPIQMHEGGYYIRLSVYDRSGAAAAIATRMAECNISLESIMQRRPWDDKGKRAEAVPVILITHATYEKSVRQALASIVADGFIAENPQVIRIEREQI